MSIKGLADSVHAALIAEQEVNAKLHVIVTDIIEELKAEHNAAVETLRTAPHCFAVKLSDVAAFPTIPLSAEYYDFDAQREKLFAKLEKCRTVTDIADLIKKCINEKKVGDTPLHPQLLTTLSSIQLVLCLPA